MKNEEVLTKSVKILWLGVVNLFQTLETTDLLKIKADAKAVQDLLDEDDSGAL